MSKNDIWRIDIRKLTITISTDGNKKYSVCNSGENLKIKYIEYPTNVKKISLKMNESPRVIKNNMNKYIKKEFHNICPEKEKILFFEFLFNKNIMFTIRHVKIKISDKSNIENL